MATLAIHGHFYQPDRRDPLTDLIPPDPTAAPAHDWNQRIYEQCYAPNARQGNYARIGYDFGPTLLTWVRSQYPGLHAAIAMQSAGESAMAQGWHHAILPLSLPRDRATEIHWGITDFAFRFGHAPAGFWMPETAVDENTLCNLVDVGIRYVILAPWQAARPVDTRRPYRIELPDDRRLIAVFYDGDLSREVSFEDRATENADRFVRDYVCPKSGRLADGAEPLLLIATDGELYGHHKMFRDHFLRALPAACARAGLTMATLGDVVAKLKVDDLPDVAVAYGTSWSCHHGLDRWSSGCPCSPDGRWKPVLRRALNNLSEVLDTASEQAFDAIGLDLWDLRDRYIVVAAGYAAADDFAAAALAGSPWADDPASAETVSGLLAAQRSRLAMFTSCGWFWEDPSRGETVMCLKYAADAIERVRRLTGVEAEAAFIGALHPLRSSVTGETGEALYRRARSEMGLS